MAALASKAACAAWLAGRSRTLLKAACLKPAHDLHAFVGRVRGPQRTTLNVAESWRLVALGDEAGASTLARRAAFAADAPEDDRAFALLVVKAHGSAEARRRAGEMLHGLVQAHAAARRTGRGWRFRERPVLDAVRLHRARAGRRRCRRAARLVRGRGGRSRPRRAGAGRRAGASTPPRQRRKEARPPARERREGMRAGRGRGARLGGAVRARAAGGGRGPVRPTFSWPPRPPPSSGREKPGRYLGRPPFPRRAPPSPGAWRSRSTTSAPPTAAQPRNAPSARRTTSRRIPTRFLQPSVRGRKGAPAPSTASAPVAPLLRVNLFGGLEVWTGDRAGGPGNRFRRQKARTLSALLVLNRRKGDHPPPPGACAVAGKPAGGRPARTSTPSGRSCAGCSPRRKGPART